jgi:hypothetical protein
MGAMPHCTSIGRDVAEHSCSTGLFSGSVVIVAVRLQILQSTGLVVLLLVEMVRALLRFPPLWSAVPQIVLDGPISLDCC